MEQDIRWKQRFANYKKALAQLAEGVENNRINPPSLIKEGIIQRFEFTHELAWKVMKDYLEYEGFLNINGSRTATREAFNIGLITEGQIWMNMIESRNNTVHTYNSDILEVEYNAVVNNYFTLFLVFKDKMEVLL
ncbi:MAG: nucleotidyltransferase substrate binding protein [bacterium]|nr:nucleotidyltransferase substrate binding protein [bacterium]